MTTSTLSRTGRVISNLRPCCFSKTPISFRPIHSAPAFQTATADRPFDFSPFDCVGFDLDHTLCRYNLQTLLPMIYDECLVPFLSRPADQGDPILNSDIAAAAAECLGSWHQSPSSNADDSGGPLLARRGLVFDAMHGTLLKVAGDGRVLHALSGTRALSKRQISSLYSSDSSLSDLVRTLVDPPGGRLRVLRDYFDAPVALAAARLIAALNSSGVSGGPVNMAVGDRLRAALVHMYNRHHFKLNDGGFFHRLRSDTPRYAFSCPESVHLGLRQLRAEGRLVFLLTSSNIDYADHMAQLALGKRWRDYFDLVLTFARKPHFFSGRLPFLAIDNGAESVPLTADQLCRGGVYSQGNWQDLSVAFQRLCSRREAPRCLYVGDNLAFDVLPIVKYTRADAVAINEDLASAEQDPSDWCDMFSHGVDATVWKSLSSKTRACVPSVECLFTK